LLAFILHPVPGSTAPIPHFRSRRWPLTLCLAPVILVLAGCGSGETPLAKLASNQAAYVGKEMTTSGIVEKQTTAKGVPYYVLADGDQNLVLLEPATRVRRYRGESVTVRGRFELDPHQGRLIRVVAINPS